MERRKLRNYLEAYLYLLSAFVLLIIFIYYPFLVSVFKSFFLTNSFAEIREFVGFDNYMDLFANNSFRKSILNTFKFTLFSVPISILISFFMAMLAAKTRRMSPLYEVFYSIPMAMSSSVSAMIFKIIFNQNVGIVNKVLNLHINWLDDISTAMWVLIIISIWMHLGYNYLFILSAVRGLPQSVLESAELDGANAFTRAYKIILPLVSPTVFFLLCNSLASALTMSNLSLILTPQGGPGKTTETMISFMYKASAQSSNYNLAFPAAVISFIIAVMAIIATFAYERKGVYYN